MFGKTDSKIEDSHILLEQMKAAKNAIEFRACFNSFLSNCRAITYALQEEGNHIKGFDEWYYERQEEMRKDQLLRFIHEARIDDFHKGVSRVVFPSTYVKYFSSSEAGPPPTENAKMVIGSEGIYWLIDKGTSRERRIPITRGGIWRTEAALDNAPTEHRGETVEKNDPVSICSFALEYLSSLVREAKEKFSYSY